MNKYECGTLVKW